MGQRLARIRKEHGLTQAQLAKKIGIAQTLISDYERGKLRLHADTIISIANALGISADALLGREKDPSPRMAVSRKVIRRMEQIEQLPPHKQRQIFVTIDALLERASS